ncbi:hypothetical protein WS58_16580 [Burkholderia pseudomultivorans]|nr:hypothetical protein WS57_35095 [Burkholderia pseudomultivorans]KVC27779.1 hypothetical protein WS55_12950 [Burkholderia pseudomultivorans]KVC36901.1 hypothetical protein WS56_00320 [Burkholderia pseudomultivorans]KVC42142.1 hypothetical protein WS58_16580 [Burkholderia pseudomultivorans]
MHVVDSAAGGKRGTEFAVVGVDAFHLDEACAGFEGRQRWYLGVVRRAADPGWQAKCANGGTCRTVCFADRFLQLGDAFFRFEHRDPLLHQRQPGAIRDSSVQRRLIFSDRRY